ncbi:MAG TPA: hypothetical protein PLV42_09370 [bacterium]|nr:hypothetical protein [bacterium]
MSKSLMFLMTVCFALILRADPPDQAWQSCDADTVCSDGYTCVKFMDMETPVCWPADSDPCEYCGTADCAVMESYPPQVQCSEETPDVDPAPCGVDADCPEGYACFEGYCEPTGEPIETEVTACKNDAGYCEIGDTSGFCQCVTGEGVGWAEAEPGETTDPGTDGGDDGEVPPQPYFLPTQDECMAKLIETCGEKAPDIKEECGEELFGACLDAVEWVEGTCYETTLTEEERAAIAKGEWVGDWSLMVYQCCSETTMEEIESDLGELKGCIEADGCDECLGGGEEPQPAVSCMENGDCPDGGICKEGTCYWTTTEGDETTSNPSEPGIPVGGDPTDDQTGGDDYANDGKGAESSTTTPKENSDSGCSLVLI